MQWKLDVRIICCCILMFTLSCMLNEQGNNTHSAGDGDGDSDGDTDGDSDGDSDGDADGDVDSDGDGGLQITSVTPPGGFTAGYALDPRPLEEKIVTIRYEGGTDSFPEVELGGINLSRICSESPEKAVKGCIQFEDRGIVRIRYPSSKVAEPSTLRLIAHDDVAEYTSGFDYSIMPLQFELQTIHTGKNDTAAAIEPGCFHDNSGCVDAQQDIAVVSRLPVPEAPNGMLRLLSAKRTGSRFASLIGEWGGPTLHNPLLTATSVIVRDVNPLHGPPAVITIGIGDSWGMRLSHFVREEERFTVDPVISCWDVVDSTTGVVSGDFMPGRDDELAWFLWRDGALDVIVTTISAECPLPTTTPTYSISATEPEGFDFVGIRPALAHLNSDSFIDLAIATLGPTGAPQVFLLWGLADNSFAEAAFPLDLPADCGRPGQVAALHVDGDDKLDLVIGCQGSNQVIIAQNGDGEEFQIREQLTLGTATDDGPALVAMGRLDPDEIPDLVVAVPQSDSFWVFQGTGSFEHSDGPFVLASAVPSATITAITDVEIADLDGQDELLGLRFADVILSGSTPSDGYVSVLWTISDL